MFKHVSAITLIALATVVSAGPVPTLSETDKKVGQFALTLEHLEDAFYTAALQKFSVKDFEAAGFSDDVYGRFKQIAAHEATHVKFLTEGLGKDAVPPCTYDFGHTLDDPKSFVKQSRVFESVGTSAYLGATNVIQDKNIVTTAGSILAVEMAQASWVSSSVLCLEPWYGPFETPLTASGAFSLAKPFIKSCPAGYPQLPVKDLPPLSLSNPTPNHGDKIKLSFPGSGNSSGSGGRQVYAAWLDGLTVTFTDVAPDGTTRVPDNVLGIVYVGVVSSKDGPTDGNLVSGLALVAFDFDARANDSATGSPA